MAVASTTTWRSFPAEARPGSCPRATFRRRGRADGRAGAAGAGAAARPDARPPQPQPRRARAEDYDEFVAFTGVDRATAERFVDGALGRGLSLRDAIRAFFEGQGSPKPPPPPPLEVSFRTNGGQTFPRATSGPRSRRRAPSGSCGRSWRSTTTASRSASGS